MPPSPQPASDKSRGLVWYHALVGWLLLIGGAAILFEAAWVAVAPDEISWATVPAIPACACLALPATIYGATVVRRFFRDESI